MKIVLATTLVLLASAVLAADQGDPVIHRDQPYADTKNEKQTLDVYAPADGKNHPIVFWIHGGGWMQGDKADVQNKPKAFVDKGFVFVSTNYRLFPNVSIKAMAGDVAKAIRWTHDHAAEFGGDPNTFFVMGHSAGAQLAALICTDDSLLKGEGMPLSMIKGCVPVDGDTYDVPLRIATTDQKSADRYKWKFGDEQSQKDLSPVTHVAKGKSIPPFLLLHVADHPATWPQAQRLAKVLQKANVSAKTFAAENSEHDKLNNGLGLPDDKPTKALFRFVDRALSDDATSDPQSPSPANAVKLAFDSYRSGYFVSNKFEPDAAESFVVATTQEQFDKVFGAAFGMKENSHLPVLPKDVFQSHIVVATIKRGKAAWEFKIRSVTVDKGVVELRYKATSMPNDSAKFTVPLIVSIPKGDYSVVEFVENGKLVKKLDIGK